MKIHIKFCYILLLFVFLISCKNESKEKVSDILQLEIDSLQAIEGEDVLYYFPSPNELMSLFMNFDLKYNETLLNSIENYKSFLSKKAQAINLGIYITDIAYIKIKSIFSK